SSPRIWDNSESSPSPTPFTAVPVSRTAREQNVLGSTLRRVSERHCPGPATLILAPSTQATQPHGGDQQGRPAALRNQYSGEVLKLQGWAARKKNHEVTPVFLTFPATVSGLRLPTAAFHRTCAPTNLMTSGDVAPLLSFLAWMCVTLSR